jgi:hypothetical protein
MLKKKKNNFLKKTSSAEKPQFKGLLNIPKPMEKIVEPEIKDKNIKPLDDVEMEIEAEAPAEMESQEFAVLIEKKKRQRRNRLIVILTIVFVFLAGLGMAAFFYFNQMKPFADEKISLTIDGPQSVKVGDEITYVLRYANEGEINIKDARLIFKEPHGFQLSQTEPETLTHSWDLGEINNNQRGEVTISGKIIDNLEVAQKITATLVFTPQNFNSEFSIEQEFATALEPIEVFREFKSPESINLGEKVTINLTLENKSAETIEKLKTVLLLPADFQVDNTTPKASANTAEWIFENMEALAKQEIKIEGSFPEGLKFENDEQRLKEFNWQIFYPNDEDQYFLQSEDKFQLKIVDQELIAYLIVNGSTEDKGVKVGETLHFSLIYKNKGEKTYKNLAVSAAIDTATVDILDWKNIDDEEFGKIEKTDTGKAITWTKTQIPELDTIDGKEEGKIDFSIPLKDEEALTGVKLSSLGKDILQTYAKLVLTDSNGSNLPAIESSKVNLHLNSDAVLIDRAAYFYDDGTPIGAGPLPPEVGKTTSYVIFWEVTNSIHEVESLKVSATIPEQVTWPNNFSVSAGEVNYNPANRQITWTINRLPLAAKNPTLTFHLELTPQATDLGKMLKILNTATFEAKDTVTQDSLMQTTGALTTNLDDDKYGVGQGIIVSAK